MSSGIDDLPPPDMPQSQSVGIDDLPPPSFMQSLIGRLPDTFGNYTPGSTPAQASLDNPELTKKLAVAGTAMAGGELVAPFLGELGGLGGVTARVAANTAIGNTAQVADNAIDNRPLTDNLGTSTLIGAGVGSLGEAAAGAAGWLDNASIDKAAKAMGATKADYNRLGADGVRALARSAKDQGFIPLFATPASIEAATGAAQDVAGQKIGALIDSSQAQLDAMPPTGMMPKGQPVQATPVTQGVRVGAPQNQSYYPPETPYSSPVKVPVSTVDPTIERAGPSGDFVTPIQPRPAGSIDAPALAAQLRANGDAAQLAKVPGQEGLADQINTFLDTLAKNPQDMTLKEAQTLRQRIDAGINWSKSRPDMAGTQQYLVNIRNGLSDAMTQSVDQAAAASGGGLGQLKQANQAYSTITKINDIAANRANMNAANRSIGLTDTIAGTGAGAVGAAVGGVAGGAPGAVAGEMVGNAAGTAGNKGLRTFGPAIMSNVYGGASKLALPVAGNPALAQGLINAGSNLNQPAPNSPVSPSMIGNTPASNDVAKTPAATGGRNPSSVPATTGPDAWAAQGIQKLGIKDTSVSARLLQDPKAKQLLIQASDLAPNSKAMNQIMSQLQKGWGTT